jgi:hypothetical protein
MDAYYFRKEAELGSASSTSAGSSSSSSTTEPAEASDGPKPNFSGVWKRVKLENYENFLAVQGASYVQRKLACSITMVHTVTMDDALTVFRLQEKGGPIDTDKLYVIGGPELATSTAKTTFLDKVSWHGNKLMMRKLRTPEENYELIVLRWLENNGKTMMTVSNLAIMCDTMSSI